MLNYINAVRATCPFLSATGEDLLIFNVILLMCYLITLILQNYILYVRYFIWFLFYMYDKRTGNYVNVVHATCLFLPATREDLLIFIAI